MAGFSTCEIFLNFRSIWINLLAMSDANKRVVVEWFEQVWNQQSEAAIDRIFHREGRSHGFPGSDAVLIGPEGFKTVQRSFCGAFPDIHVDLESVVAEGDQVAVRWTATMTHSGDHLGFPVTGKRARLSGASFTIVKDGQILEGWNFMDLPTLFQQLQAQ